MKPSFALNLTHEGIGLLHRASGGWHLVGEASLTDTALSETLGFLRQTAIALEPGGVTTKLVIPNSQILYHTIPLPSVGSEIPDAIETALDGLTPYAVSELAFDWHQNGEEIQIAAVARETLAEAEEFAVEHKFNPVCFVAIPEDQPFEGEPNFGETKDAERILATAGALERDETAISIVATPEPVAPTDAEPEEAAPEPEEETAAPDAEVVETPALDESTKEATSEDSASDSAELADDGDSEAPEPDADTAPEPEPEPEPAPEPAPAFTSRRAQSASAETDNPSEAGVTLPAARLSIGTPTADEGVPRLGGAIGATGVTAPLVPDAPEPANVPPAPKTEVTPAVAPTHQASTPVAKPDTPKKDASAEDLTVFGARRGDANRGKPRHLGLIMTFSLVIVLAIVAIWSTFYLEDGISGLWGPSERETDPIIANLAEPTDESVAQIPETLPVTTTPDATSEAETNTEVATAEPAPEAEIIAPVITPEPAPQFVELSREDAETAYTRTGVWERAPDASRAPLEGDLNDIYVASADPEIASLDALALPVFDPTPGLTKLPEQFNPAPSGTSFELDERGFVIATEEGAMNPDGILVFAGKPPSVPRARPRNAAVPGTAELDVAGLALLASHRPAARPSNLQEIHERGLYGGLTLAELSKLRPEARPASPQNAPGIDQTPTEFAVATSPVPTRRPGNIAEIIATARANQENQVAAQVIASATPQRSSAAAGRAPDIPTRASVAQQATVPNAINLRQISLIGVYGSASDRRALLRLRNGRYVKVEIGDQVDGGRVAAIGDQNLQYVKGGRNITLQMP